MTQEFLFRLHIQGIHQSWIFEIPVGPKPIIIGRQPGIDIVLDHQQVSRRHAAINCTATECQIADLGSANGTRVNGQKITPQIPILLKPGDSIQIGGFNLDFEQIPVEKPAEVEPIDASELVAFAAAIAPRNEEAETPPPPPPSLPPVVTVPRFDPSQPPPGLTFRSERLLSYLPGIYHTAFMANFLAIFESVLFPIEWEIDNFDLFLDPGTTPSGFLPWLANWFGIITDSTWTEPKQRAFLREAYAIFSRAGTKWSLSRILEIYSECAPEIDDQSEDLLPHRFRVRLSGVATSQRKNIERLIDTYKPAHTTYILEMDQ